MHVLDDEQGGLDAVGQETQHRFERVNVIRAGIKRLAMRARDVAQRQQHLGSREVFAGAPIHARTLCEILHKAFRQCRLAGTRLGRKGDNTTLTLARVRKGIA